MEKDREDTLTQILANNYLNSIKFKDVVELVKFHSVNAVKNDLDKMENEDKEALLDKLEKQIEEAQAKAKEEDEKAQEEAAKAEQEIFEKKVEQAEAILGPGQRVTLDKDQQKSVEEGQKELTAETP